jgi:chemosensory pili system protein ChpA (sensor histidine kinase/response regulator)
VEIGSREFFREGENMYGLIKLENILSLSHDRRTRNMDTFPALLTRMNDGTVCAVQVQEILDSREVVMKNFGRYVPRSQGVVGAVILGDGGVAPVIDLVELLNMPVQQTLAAQIAESQSGSRVQTRKKALNALVVDDSLSARRAMAQVLKDAGFDVRTANDGLDAVNILEKYVPDIILSDMEMPRMNGLELTSHVRYAERTKHIPVIMITSRSTEKHRQMSSSAGVNVHIVKPFSDDILLQHVAKLTA